MATGLRLSADAGEVDESAESYRQICLVELNRRSHGRLEDCKANPAHIKLADANETRDWRIYTELA